MWEVTNLAWPASPYSSAHRPITRPTQLVTGLSIGRGAWAAVHLPAHGTRPLDPTAIRIGVHAVLLHDADRLHDGADREAARHEASDHDAGPSRADEGWQPLDRILAAGRRQATAIAGLDLGPRLDHARRQIEAAGAACPGISALLLDWPAPTRTPPTPRTAHAQLLDLTAADLPAPAADLLTRHGHPKDAPEQEPLPATIAAAAAAAIAAGVWTGRHVLTGSVDLWGLLDDAIGDQVTIGARPTVPAVQPLV